MDGNHNLADTLPRPNQLDWLAPDGRVAALKPLGFRFAPGGVHLSKTMMLAELRVVLDASDAGDFSKVEQAVLGDNVLAKPTGTARRLALSRLNTLYGIGKPFPVQAA